jgi:hypothetical protein
VTVEVLDAHSQVVAGTNYRLKVKAIHEKVAAFYEAQVWGEDSAFCWIPLVWFGLQGSFLMLEGRRAASRRCLAEARLRLGSPGG